MSFEPEPPLTMGDPYRTPPPPPGKRPGGRGPLLFGAAVLVALGVGAAVMARGQLFGAGAASGDARKMDIVMGERPPEPKLPPVGEKLETLSPETVARAELPPAQAAPPPEPLAGEPPLPPQAPEAPQPPEPPWPQAPRRAPRPPEPPPAPVAREPTPFVVVGVDCADTRSLADEMTCSDPALTAADRQMVRAFRRAVRAGAPYGQLRAEQNDWMAMREDAALRSPRALARLYDQRIDDLNAIADGR